MSRTEAGSKGLYYPTWQVVVHAIARYLRMQPHTPVHLLDNSCGKGKALRILADALDAQNRAASALDLGGSLVSTYGVELNTGRARLAAHFLDHVIQAGYLNAHIAKSSFQLAFCNPPYDIDMEHAQHKRLELTFLYRVTQHLAPQGILVYIVPQSMLAQAATFLAAWYTDITVLRFPSIGANTSEDHAATTLEPVEKLLHPKLTGEQVIPDMYDQFKQVVLFGVRRDFAIVAKEQDIQRLRAYTAAGADLPVIDCTLKEPVSHLYTLPRSIGAPAYFLAKAFNPDQAAERIMGHKQSDGTLVAASAGLTTAPSWRARRWPDLETLSSFVTLLAPMKKGHLVQLVAAGLANGLEITGTNGQRLLLQGHAKPVIVESVSEDEGVTIHRRRTEIRSSLVGIDLDTGIISCIQAAGKGGSFVPPAQVQSEQMPIDTFLALFGHALAVAVAQHNPARYQSALQVPWAKEALNGLLRQPLGKQRQFILAHVNAIHQGLTRLPVIAEMATGKSFLSLAIISTSDLWVTGLTDRYASLRRKRHGHRLLFPHLFPALILSPEVVARPWKREAEQTIPGVQAIVIEPVQTRAQAEAFRAFCPLWHGEKLSALGMLEQVIAQIKRDLADWERACVAARASGEPLPKHPAHVVILPGGLSKRSMRITPVYRMAALHVKERGKTRVLSRTNEDGSVEIIEMPHCVTCGLPIVKPVKKEKAKPKNAADTDYDETDEEAVFDYTRYATETDLHDTINQAEGSAKWFCIECGAPLFQYTDGTLETHSIAPLPGQQVERTITVEQLPGTVADYLGKAVFTLSEQERELAETTPAERVHVHAKITSEGNYGRSSHARSWPLADYIRQHHPGLFQSLLADEAHQGADGTALGLARESLMQCIRYCFPLTGTLCNGRASSLFPLARMVNSEVRRRFGYQGVRAWVRAYGFIVEEQKEYHGGEQMNPRTGIMTKKREGWGVPLQKESSGFAPQGLPLLLAASQFLELADVAPALLRLRETVYQIPMGELLGKAYRKFQDEITSDLGQLLAAGDKSMLAAWYQALLGYCNQPWNKEPPPADGSEPDEVYGWDCYSEKNGCSLGTAPALPAELIYPKEAKLVELIAENMREGRRCLVYAEHTKTYNILPRLKQVIETEVKRQGLRVPKVAILTDSTVKTLDREQWILDQVAKGVDVIICQPQLVQVGLNLREFSTIIFYEIPSSTSVLRQASRRHHRPGQTNPCRVELLVYQNAMEMRLLLLKIKDLQAALAVEGQLPGEGLVSFHSGDEDEQDGMSVAYTLAKQLLKAMQDGTVDSLEDGAHLQTLMLANEQVEAEAQRELPDSTDPLAELGIEAVYTEQVAIPEPEVGQRAYVETAEPIIVVPVSRLGNADLWQLAPDKRASVLKRRKRARKAEDDAATLFDAVMAEIEEIVEAAEAQSSLF